MGEHVMGMITDSDRVNWLMEQMHEFSWSSRGVELKINCVFVGKEGENKRTVIDRAIMVDRRNRGTVRG